MNRILQRFLRAQNCSTGTQIGRSRLFVNEIFDGGATIPRSQKPFGESA